MVGLGRGVIGLGVVKGRGVVTKAVEEIVLDAAVELSTGGR